MAKSISMTMVFPPIEVTKQEFKEAPLKFKILLVIQWISSFAILGSIFILFAKETFDLFLISIFASWAVNVLSTVALFICAVKGAWSHWKQNQK